MFVANQPQFKLALPLVIFAWLIGALFKGFFSSDRIQSYLDEAQLSLPPGISLKFKSGEISLANGWMPEFALLLKDVSIGVTSTCLVNPELRIANARLPLLGLIKKKPSWNVALGETVLTLRSPFEDCFNKQVVTQPQLKQKSPDQNVNESPLLPSVPSDQNGELDSLFIEKLIVHDLSRAQPVIGLEWKLFKWERIQGRNSWKSQFQFQAPGELLASTAPLRIITEINANQADITVTAKGFWREGILEFVASGDINKKDFQLDYEFTDFPVESVLSLAKMYHFLNIDGLTFGKNWISAKGQIASSQPKNEVRFDGMTLQGDVGLLKLENSVSFDLQKLNFESPLKIKAEKLSLSFLGGLIQDQRVKNSIKNFGSLTGQISIQDKEMDFSGKLQGLSFIFSNLGSRADQIMNECALVINSSKVKKSFSLEDCILEGGEFRGQISGNLDSTDQFKVDLKIENLILSPKVQRVLTRGGSVNALNGYLSVQDQSKGLRLSGNLESSGLKTLGSDWSKLKLGLKDSEGGLLVSFTGRGHFDPDSGYLQFLKPLSLDEAVESDFMGEFAINDKKSWAWKKFLIDNSQWQIKSDGQFNSQDQVSGELQMKDKVQEVSKKFKLSGTRDLPKLELFK